MNKDEGGWEEVEKGREGRVSTYLSTYHPSLNYPCVIEFVGEVNDDERGWEAAWDKAEGGRKERLAGWRGRREKRDGTEIAAADEESLDLHVSLWVS